MRRTVMLLVLLAAGCGTPTAPTPPPTPALALTCPAPVFAPATSVGGANVSYTAPIASGGRAPLSIITCTPGSGLLFPVGTTTVACSVTDAALSSATCSFPVAVTPVPRLRLVRYMAFGDSVTAGEVTFPVTNRLSTGATPVYRQIVVPPASYPSVLLNQLRQRYFTQSIAVVNAGLSGEKAANGFARFQTAMATNRPEVVLLLTGYNDLDNRATVEAAYRSLERMAKEGRGLGARVFLATLTPSIPGRLRSQLPDMVLQLNASIRTLAAGEQAVLVDLYQAALPNVDAWIGADGLHPTEAGYARIADTFFAAIRADLEVR